MKKKILALALSVIMLMSTFAVLPVFAADADPFSNYVDGEIQFASYTTGADAAFDGKADTGFDGSITGRFDGNYVLSGVTITALGEVTGIVVSGSDNGTDWVKLYEAESADEKFPAEFGSFGSNHTGTIRDQMYTYVFEYVRIETASGSIAEVDLFGYKVEVEGQMMDLDTNWETNGYKVNRSHYTPAKTEFVFDHLIGADWNKGDCVKPNDGDETKTGYFAVKLEKATVVTEISFAQRGGETSANALKRFNGIYFEASVDGTAWTTLATTGDDFYQTHDMTKSTICILDVNDNTEYNYVRIRSDKDSQGSGWLQLAEFNVFGKAAASTVDPATVLNNWDGDPHVAGATTPTDPDNGGEEPTEETTAAPEETTAAPETTAKETAAEESGCGSTVTISALAIVGACGAVCTVGMAKRKKSKED